MVFFFMMNLSLGARDSRVGYRKALGSWVELWCSYASLMDGYVFAFNVGLVTYLSVSKRDQIK